MFDYDSININIVWCLKMFLQAMEPWKQSPGPHCLWTLVIGKACRSGGWILVRLSLSACRSSGMIVYKILAVLVIFPFLRRNPYIKSISWNAPKTTNCHHKDSIVVADASFGCSTYFFLCRYSCCCRSIHPQKTPIDLQRLNNHFLAIWQSELFHVWNIYYTWKPTDLYKANVYR